ASALRFEAGAGLSIAADSANSPFFVECAIVEGVFSSLSAEIYRRRSLANGVVVRRRGCF
ncbi:MAG: hypothetical protein WB678_08410, partial [Stellaceae bacterium]